MKLFSQLLLSELATKATASPRQRANHNIHASSEDPVQRFFVCAHRSSYFRPHRHVTRSEMTVVLKGTFIVLTFDAEGTVTGRHEVGEHAPNLGFETPRATWHTLVAMTDGSTFLEVKEGPYDPATSAEFAPWAPAEGDPKVRAFVAWLRNAQPGLKPR
jgi:cupin fold WbuC family metalloprotein